MSIIRMNGWKKYIRMQRLSDKAAGDSLLFTLRSNSNGFCRCFACRIGKIPQPLRYLTEFSVQKIPTVNCNGDSIAETDILRKHV